MKIFVIILSKYEIVRNSVDFILDIAEEMEIPKKEDFFKCEERKLNKEGSKVLTRKRVSLDDWYELKNRGV